MNNQEFERVMLQAAEAITSKRDEAAACRHAASIIRAGGEVADVTSGIRAGMADGLDTRARQLSAQAASLAIAAQRDLSESGEPVKTTRKADS